jgi:hypothetical protein
LGYEQGIRVSHRVLEGYSRGTRGFLRGRVGYQVAARGTRGTLGVLNGVRWAFSAECYAALPALLRSSQQALDGYSSGYSSRGCGVYAGLPRGLHAHARDCSRPFSRERETCISARARLSHTPTRVPARTHAPHSFRILSLSLLLIVGYMNVSADAFVRASVCVRECVRASVREVIACLCVRPCVCVCPCTRAFVSAHVRVHSVHFHGIPSSRARARVMNSCVRRGAVCALLWHGGNLRSL